MAEQTTLDQELAAKEKGIDLVALHNQGFVKAMREAAVGVAKAKGHVTSDDLREIAEQLHVKPEKPNAWGTIFSGHEGKKIWVLLGRRPSTFPGNHAREIKVWGLR